MQVIDVTGEADIASALPVATSVAAVLLCAWDATQLETLLSLLAATRLSTPAEGTTRMRTCSTVAAFHILQTIQHLAIAA